MDKWGEHHLDAEDSSDAVPDIERSLGITFNTTELENVRTFGQLCDVALARIEGEHVSDCTTQQAFYKLRNTMADTLNVDRLSIGTNTALSSLFPETTGRVSALQFEQSIGMQFPKVSRLYPFEIVTLLCLLIGMLSSNVWLTAMLLAITGINIVRCVDDRFEYQAKTVGELAEQMFANNYIRSRRNPSTVNPKEVEQVLRVILSERTATPAEEITREIRFVQWE